jgi:hypothetical protein
VFEECRIQFAGLKGLTARTHLLRTALCGDQTRQAASCAQLKHVLPCVKLWTALEKPSQSARGIPPVIKTKYEKEREGGGGGRIVHVGMYANVQVVAPEWVAAYEPNGHRTPLGWARTIVLMAGVMVILNAETFNVFIHRDRRFGRRWTNGLLVRAGVRIVRWRIIVGRMAMTKATIPKCW